MAALDLLGRAPNGPLVEPDGGLLVEPPTGSYRVLSSHDSSPVVLKFLSLVTAHYLF